MKERYLKAKRALFDKVYGEKLNPEQCRAVFTTKGPLLVLAGAGSGKTTVLVNRIAYIIKYGNAYYSENVPEGLSEGDVVALENALALDTQEISNILPEFITEPTPPWSVLAITFTNKAANEIKERLVRTFADEEMAKAIWAGTFHSICMRILRKYGERVGLREGFSIYDTEDKKRLVTMCMRELEIDEKRLSAKVVCTKISEANDTLKHPDDLEDTRDPRSRDIREIYKLYQRRMSEYNAVDFDDIIMKTVELLEDEADVREYYQNKFRYVLVDEYQDTNYAQFMLTKIISDKRRNIMVVGDDDQSIYKFRGATIENILNFDKTYEDATVVKLEQNYRSTANILAAANSVIRNNGDRHDKRLWCDKGNGDKIVVREVEDQGAEGRYIIDIITRNMRSEGRKYSDFAILYRINALGRSLQTTFAKSGVPYRVLGDMGFYDRKEIKDILAYLSVYYSADDDLRLKRIINEPKRKIGNVAVDAIEQIAKLTGTSMYRVIQNADEYSALAKYTDKLRDFTRIFEGIREDCILPSDTIRALFERSGYRDMLKGEGFEGETKIENVEELISAALEYEKRCAETDTEPTLSGFLEEISLISDVDKYDENADAVVLMTVHSAKGLEFPVVFIAGMEDGIFPSTQNIGEPSEMSEERRLAYVAITRAKEKLYITHAKSRLMYGKSTYNMLSGFVRQEIPMSLVETDRPRPAPPRSYIPDAVRQRSTYERERTRFTEMKRPVEIGNQTSQRRTSTAKSGAAQYGVIRLAVGQRVGHAMFGDGVIVSSRDMGGDVLYEVRFDSGETKRLMATFAHLEKI